MNARRWLKRMRDRHDNSELEVPYIPVSHLPDGYRGEACVWWIDTQSGGEHVRARLRGPHAVHDDAGLV